MVELTEALLKFVRYSEFSAISLPMTPYFKLTTKAKKKILNLSNITLACQAFLEIQPVKHQ